MAEVVNTAFADATSVQTDSEAFYDDLGNLVTTITWDSSQILSKISSFDTTKSSFPLRRLLNSSLIQHFGKKDMKFRGISSFTSATD